MKALLTYRLQALEMANGKTVTFSEPITFWPVNKNRAIITPGNGWPGKLAIVSHGHVKGIGYSISATNEKVCVSEYFHHPVKRECIIDVKSPFFAHLEGAPLFTSTDAAWLLKTASLKGQKTIQFVC